MLPTTRRLTSRCHCADCRIWLAWSGLHPTALTNWLTIICLRKISVFGSILVKYHSRVPSLFYQIKEYVHLAYNEVPPQRACKQKWQMHVIDYLYTSLAHRAPLNSGQTGFFFVYKPDINSILIVCVGEGAEFNTPRMASIMRARVATLFLSRLASTHPNRGALSTKTLGYQWDMTSNCAAFRNVDGPYTAPVVKTSVPGPKSKVRGP